MSTIEDGGPAFAAGAFEHNSSGSLAWQDGMSLRDFFAAKAMQSLLTTIDEFPDEHWRTGVATDAYSMADAMLAARKGGMQP